MWGGGAMSLQIVAYLGQGAVPLAYVTSVRSLVFRADTLLVMRNHDSTHIAPGGRREKGERLEDTVRREVLEEAGWTIHPALLGFMHFHHLAPKPEGYVFPHPDFLQVVYMAQAETYCPDAKLPDDYEIETTYLPLAAVHSLPLTDSEQVYLAAALERRRVDHLCCDTGLAESIWSCRFP